MNSRRASQSPKTPQQEIHQEMILNFVAEREADHARLARFLHDEVGQVLSAVGLQLDALRHDFGASVPELEQRAGGIQQMLETIIGKIRDLSYELNPSIVQRIGLQFALERLATRFQTGSSCNIRLFLDPTIRVPPDRAEAMYRGAEVVMALASGNTECTLIEVQLKRHRTGAVLEIRANASVGLEAQSSFPALLMNYYASRNSITLSVNRSGENDTIVKFTCPVD